MQIEALFEAFHAWTALLKRRFFTKTVLVMNLASVLIVVGCLQAAAGGFGQNITYSGQNVPLETVFKSIKEQTGFLVVYNSSLLQDAKPITVSAKDMPLSDFLRQTLKGQPFDYQIEGKTIVLSASSSPRRSSSGVGDFVPPVPIRIRVVDADGNPLSGASIINKNTGNSGVTDAEGVSNLNVSVKDVLEISFVGYASQSFIVKDVSVVLTIVLKPAETTLEEVQVELNGGYYTTTKVTSTGNIARVTAEEISKQPVINPLQALQGRMAGVEIVQVTGIPGGPMKFQIRGQNSLRGEGNYPLYVIDGVPISSIPVATGSLGLAGSDPLNTINPENIESIEILKDADATAIYGSRGANGVVLITTKKAKEENGRTNLEVSVYRGAGKANQMKNLLNSQQYLAMRREALRNDNDTPNPLRDRDLLLWDTTRYTNWQDVLFGGTANSTDAQLAFSGGSATTSFRFSTGYHKETMVFPGDFGYSRISGGLNVVHHSADNKFNISVTTNYAADNNDQFNSDLVTPAINLAPVAPALYNEDGSLNWQIVDGASTWRNPLAPTLESHNVKSYNLITNAVIRYEVLEGLYLKTSLGYTRMTNDDIMITPLSSANPTASVRQNLTRVGNSNNKSWIVEPQVNYNRNIGKGKLALILGSTWQASVSGQLAIVGIGYPSDELLGDLSSAAQVFRTVSSGSEYRYTAVFSRLSYDWNEKYLLNLTARRDGSSRFGPDKKFANFGSVGAGWVFSNERFIQGKIPYLSFGKLRTSYGSTGSDAIGDYGYLDTYTATANPYQNVSGLYPFALSNPDYAWEVVRKLEAGLELGFFQDRISLTTSWFRNRSSNQLVGEPLPKFTGFSSVSSNLPATVQNTGMEFVLNTTNVSRKSLTWTSSLNLTFPRNKLIAYPGIEGSAYANAYVVGKSLNIVRLFHSTGVNPQTGFYEVEDVNGDGLYDIDDKKIEIDQGRKFYGGLNNTISWKQFQMSFLLEFVKQTGMMGAFIFDQTPGARSSDGGNQSTEVLGRWQKEGDITLIQKFTQSIDNRPIFSRMMQSDRVYSDASFIRLKTISLNYNLPLAWVERIKLRNAKIYVQGQNLLTLTNYTGLDAQIPGRKELPALKMLSAGFQFGL